MAAINVIRQAKVVHILSDGAFCDAGGIVCELGPITFVLPHLRAAIAIRGPGHIMPFLLHRLSRECRSFEDVLRRIVPVALDVHSSFPMTLGTMEHGGVEPDFDLVVAGWSTVRNEPTSYLVRGHDGRTLRPAGAREAWQLIELPDITITPPVDDEQIKAVGWNVPQSAEAFQPTLDGVKLLQAQRRSRKFLDPLQPKQRQGYTVGGFVQLTSVSLNDVSSGILHRWPDEVGRKIQSDLDRLPHP